MSDRMPTPLRSIPIRDTSTYPSQILAGNPCYGRQAWRQQREVMATTRPRVAIAAGVASGLMFGCAASPSAPPGVPAAPTVQGARALPTPSPNPSTVAPGPGFTPEVTQRNSAGVPLAAAPGGHRAGRVRLRG